MYEEDNPPMEKPKGILSSTETLPTMGLGQMGEQMAPEEGDASDAESVHAQTIMEAIKSGDSEALRDSLAAFTRECVRNYERGKKGKPE
jgi:DNA-binding GntR family transcriptional regulator